MSPKVSLAVAALALSLPLALGCGAPPKSEPDDGGPPPTDINPQAAACVLPSGRACRDVHGGTTCPADDGCNWCGCGVAWSNSATAACTQAGCATPDPSSRPNDAPQWPGCRDQADCPTNYACVFDPGCDQTLGRCSSQKFYCPHKNGTFTVCGCDGKTATFTALGCEPDRAYAYAGACK